MFKAEEHPEMTQEQLRDAHNRWVDSLGPEFQVHKIGKTPYEAMLEGLGIKPPRSSYKRNESNRIDMTSKELANKARLHPRNPTPLQKGYLFTEDQFEEFCGQLCKEQNKAVLSELLSVHGVIPLVQADMIENTPPVIIYPHTVQETHQTPLDPHDESPPE